jgi:hypothetical protein
MEGPGGGKKTKGPDGEETRKGRDGEEKTKDIPTSVHKKRKSVSYKQSIQTNINKQKKILPTECAKA